MKTTAIKDAFSKSEMLAEISEETGLPRKDVVAVMDSLEMIISRHLKPRSAGEFKMPGLFKIRTVEKGRFTPQLKRTDWRGRHLAKEECAFAVMGRERTVDLEAADEATRDKWVRSLALWVRYMKAMRKKDAEF